MPNQYQSAAFLAVSLQRPVNVVVDALRDLRIAPACMINGTSYYDDEAGKRVADRLQLAEPVRDG